MVSSPLISLALIGLLSIVCQWLAFRLRLPAILPLLLTGLALGPGLQLLSPDRLLGELLFPLVSLAVAIILFEGALTLKFSQLQDENRLVLKLVSIAMLITFALAGLSAFVLLPLSWEAAALLGALVVVTGPTVIAPLLRSVRVSGKLATLLHWEGIIIDPIGALLAVLVYEFITASQGQALGQALATFTMTVVVGSATGASAGFLLARALKKRMFPRYLENVAVLTLVLTAFAVSNELMHESGLLTVTLMGIWLANSKDLDLEPILAFKETLTVLLISGLFILLAARLGREDLTYLGWDALGWLTILLLIARPLAVWLATIGSNLSPRERWLLGWIAPRGIVAAAISSLFALKLASTGLLGAEQLVPLVFMVIVATVLLQSVLTAPLVRWLGLEAPDRNGFMIFGANPFAIAVARQLHHYGIPVLLSDTNWDNLSQARMQGLSVYYGHPTSEHADSQLDLTLISRLLVLSPYRQHNTEVAYHFQDRFGLERVYRLPEANQGNANRQQATERHQRLFGEHCSYGLLHQRMHAGHQIKATGLTDSYDWPQYQQDNPEALPLFALNDKGRLRVFTADAPFTPAPQWQVVALCPPESRSVEQ
ncbi:cation:proton antiporter [Ferrimonas kyonanensis]|uniref:cation:proton antiporter n=1 Tax=Ferrimonas kyonanensis TaxID=364763 RepID=UPI000400937E|nr:sodium:proton antiporter [Ferrimonas kyonanensis]